MRFTHYILFLLLIVSSMIIGCKNKHENVPNDNIYIDIAKEALTAMNIDYSKGTILLDENNNRYYDEFDKKNSGFAILKDKEFQTVLYIPKLKEGHSYILGGGVWMFIDKGSNKMIYVHRSK